MSQKKIDEYIADYFRITAPASRVLDAYDAVWTRTPRGQRGSLGRAQGDVLARLSEPDRERLREIVDYLQSVGEWKSFVRRQRFAHRLLNRVSGAVW